MKSSSYHSTQQHNLTNSNSTSRKNNLACGYPHSHSHSHSSSIAGAGESARSHSLVGNNNNKTAAASLSLSLGGPAANSISSSLPHHANIYYSTNTTHSTSNFNTSGIGGIGGYHSHNPSLMGQKSSKKSNNTTNSLLGSELGGTRHNTASEQFKAAMKGSKNKGDVKVHQPVGNSGASGATNQQQQSAGAGQNNISGSSKKGSNKGNAASGGGQGASGTTGAAGGSAAAAVGNNRKCDVCAVDMDPEHPDTADHEAHRVQQRPNRAMLFEIDLDKSEDVLNDLSPFIDLSHKLILTQESPSWVHKRYWHWKESVCEILDPDSILDMVSTRRMERLFYPDHDDTTTNLFWRNLAERIFSISRLRSGQVKEYDRLEFVERFLPCSATLAFDCMFAVGKKEVSYRDERNNEYTRWRDFFVIQSLYTLHEVRHFIIDWLPRKVDLEGVKFTPELQLGIREVREERLENFESRSDLVTCVFFVADIDPSETVSHSNSHPGGGGGGASGGSNSNNNNSGSTTSGMSSMPHIVILYNFWIRSYDETRARDVSRTLACPLFDVFNREVGTNHVLRSYQSYLVMTYMNTYATQGKMILYKINGMSDNNPELLPLDTRTINPTITVAAGWQKVAYKSLMKPTEVNILLLSELKPMATVNLNPICANHQLRIKYSGDILTNNSPDTIQTYGVSLTGSSGGDEAVKTGGKVPLNVLLSKFNQSTAGREQGLLVFKSAPVCGLQVNAKIKAQSATIESHLFSMDNIELVLGPREEFASSTNRADVSSVASSTANKIKESKPFTLAATSHGDGNHGGSGVTTSTATGILTPEVFQGTILNYAILNNCIAILYQDSSCHRLIKITT